MQGGSVYFPAISDEEKVEKLFAVVFNLQLLVCFQVA